MRMLAAGERGVNRGYGPGVPGWQPTCDRQRLGPVGDEREERRAGAAEPDPRRAGLAQTRPVLLKAGKKVGGRALEGVRRLGELRRTALAQRSRERERGRA